MERTSSPGIRRSEARRTPVSSAIADPEGARVALLTYGEIADYPDLGFGPLRLEGGATNWKEAIARAQPLWLGVAWQQIEVREGRHGKEQRMKEKGAGHVNRKPLDDEDIDWFDLAHGIQPKQTTKQKEGNVPVLQWTETGESLAAGIYPALIKSLEEEDGNFGPQLRLQFIVLDDDGEETDGQIRGWCSQKWGEKSKLYKWAKAILGKKCPQPTQPLDTDRLAGRKCDIVVGPRKKADGTIGTGIEEVYPYKTMSVNADNDAFDSPFEK